jgi:hypothetical protein
LLWTISLGYKITKFIIKSFNKLFEKERC